MFGREYVFWAVRLILIIATYLLISQVIATSTHGNPLAVSSINSLVLIMVLCVISHILIVALNLTQNKKREIQTEQPCILLSVNFGGHLLAFVVVIGLAYYLYSDNGVALFTICFIGLVMSQACEYFAIIFLARQKSMQTNLENG